MNTLACIVVGGLVVAILGGAWFAYRRRNDDWDDFGGPYL